MSPAATVHAGAVLIGEAGVLIRGRSGSGKSSLLLSLLSGDDAALVADDRVELSVHHGRLLAAAPDSIAGMLEVRGQPIARLPFVSPAVIDLIVELMPERDCPRLPGAGEETAIVAGVALPRVFIAIGTVGSVDRVRHALNRARH